MTSIRTKDDLKALSRRLGMVNAAAADMGLYDEQSDMKQTQDRIAATRLRELGMPEEKIRAKFGYSPEPFDDAVTSAYSPSF